MFSRLRIARTGRSFVPDDDLQPHLTPLDEFWFDVNERPETHRPPGVGDVFPDFIAPSTQGQLQFHDWAKGHWVHLFSMPDAFGPVGTSEVLGIAHHALDFDALDVRNIAISPMPRIDLHMWKRELERAFAICAGCHDTRPGLGHRVGPNLHGVIGRKAGTAPGYHYSEAMKNSGIVWDAQTLDAFIKAPTRQVPGSSSAGRERFVPCFSI